MCNDQPTRLAHRLQERHTNKRYHGVGKLYIEGYRGHTIYMIVKLSKISQNLKNGKCIMTNDTPSGVKKHRKSPKPESHQMAKMFSIFLSSSSSSSDELVQNCTRFSQRFSHRTAAFYTRFFTTLKTHEAVQTGHY